VLPVSGPPLPGGVVTVRGDRILAVEPHGARRPDQDFGDAAIIPGLVNAHTHLDLSGFRERIPHAGTFPDWLAAVVAHRRALTPEQAEADVRAGLTETLRHGTTLLGDISAGGASWPALADAPLRSVVFYEMLGLTKERAAAALRAAAAWLAAHPATDRCRPALSPHAPYSVRESLLVEAAALARDSDCALAVHLAESREELELLHHRRGPFVSFLQGLGVYDPDGPVRSPTDVLWICRMGNPTLFIHGNYLAPAARVRGNGTVVYCPRTHAHFGHPPHPFRRLLARGTRVALGTDSRASNPDLDLLAEARFLHRLHPDLPGGVLLRLATLSGAEALGWADETGSLEAGKSADLVVVPLLPDGDEPHDLLFGGDAAPSAVLCRGHWLTPPGGA
jgi:cytosine/adenosine deaminase-related metal-dependent hydrolase